MSMFYIVQKNGVPAIWQVRSENGMRLLHRRRKEYSLASESPSNSRREALKKLRELFPSHRPSRANTDAA